MTEIEGWQTLDDNGIKMPWYTRPCLEWLDKLYLKGKRVFEYGVGYSTLWYQSRGALTYGVDHDQKWADFADVICIEIHGVYSSLNYKMQPFHQSIHPLAGKFDIICIDGILRDECTEMALRSIKKGGHIIIDNWKQASADLAEWPITEKLIEGMDITIYKEPTHEDWKTLVIHV